MRKYKFSWELLGNLEEGRPNLGPYARVEVYRLMQFAFRDVLESSYGTEAADKLFYDAGKLAGEEFIFLFPETGHEAGVQVAERLRSAIEETPIELDDGQMVGITVSIGVTAIEGSKITNKPDIVLREAVQLADAALYKAKADGRNKVISSFDNA